jgi:hypothetical protein
MAIDSPFCFNIYLLLYRLEVGCLGMTWKPEFSVRPG